MAISSQTRDQTQFFFPDLESARSGEHVEGLNSMIQKRDENPCRNLAILQKPLYKTAKKKDKYIMGGPNVDGQDPLEVLNL